MSLNVKKEQRKINRYVRAMNKNLAEDNLWHGRFEVRQVERIVYFYEDGSGLELNVYLEIVDKKTKISQLVYLAGSSPMFPYYLWEAVNDFLCNIVEVKCVAEEKNWNEVSVSPHSFAFWRNHYSRIYKEEV